MPGARRPARAVLGDHPATLRGASGCRCRAAARDLWRTPRPDAGARLEWPRAPRSRPGASPLGRRSARRPAEPRRRGGGRRARLPRGHRGAPAAAGARRLARPGRRHPASARRDRRRRCRSRLAGTPRTCAERTMPDQHRRPARWRGEHRPRRPGIPLGVRRDRPAGGGAAGARGGRRAHGIRRAGRGLAGAPLGGDPTPGGDARRGRERRPRTSSSASVGVLQDHSTDLADLVARSRAVEERAAAGGLAVRDGRVEVAWGVTGTADAVAGAGAGRAARGAAGRARPRARPAPPATRLGARGAAGLDRRSRARPPGTCATDERIAGPTNERTRGCE